MQLCFVRANSYYYFFLSDQSCGQFRSRLLLNWTINKWRHVSRRVKRFAVKPGSNKLRYVSCLCTREAVRKVLILFTCRADERPRKNCCVLVTTAKHIKKGRWEKSREPSAHSTKPQRNVMIDLSDLCVVKISALDFCLETGIFQTKKKKNYRKNKLSFRRACL